MRKFITVVKSGMENIFMKRFAYAFAEGSVKRICYYVFHQPKMPEEVKSLRK